MFIHTYETTSDFLTDKPCKYVAAFTLQKGMLESMTEWCHVTFGPEGYQPLTHETRWKNDIFYGEVFFSRKEDLEWFVLRWS